MCTRHAEMQGGQFGIVGMLHLLGVSRSWYKAVLKSSASCSQALVLHLCISGRIVWHAGIRHMLLSCSDCDLRFKCNSLQESSRSQTLLGSACEGTAHKDHWSAWEDCWCG